MALFYQDFDTAGCFGRDVSLKSDVGCLPGFRPGRYRLVWLLVLLVFCGVIPLAYALDDHMEAEELSAGLPPDAGVEAYRFAAQQGDVLAQLNLGAMFYYGLGTAKNYSKALFWYQKAAQQDEPLAQFKLGVMLEEGLGITRDLAVAVEWFRKVAVRNLPMDSFATDIVGWSRLKLGLMYKDGKGVVKDLAQSAQWYRMAAERGYALAQFQLGQLELQGGDKVAALKWFKIAAAQGHVEASGQVGALEKQLSPDQVAKAVASAAQPIPPVVPPRSPVVPPVVNSLTHVALPVEEPLDTQLPSSAPSKPNSLPVVGKSIVPLTIEADPPDAKVQILNITPPYYPGMALEPGRYHVKITQEGFEAQKRWVTLGNSPMRVAVKLERLPSSTVAAAEPSKVVAEMPKPPVKKTEPPVKKMEQSAQETKLPVKKTEPPAQETKPPVKKTELPAQETKPPVKKTELPAQETKPPVQKTESPVEESKSLPEKPDLLSTLQVNPEPGDAKVRILNIRQAYTPGMKLKAGRYLVEVSRPGYKTASHWMQLPGGGEFEITAPLESE